MPKQAVVLLVGDEGIGKSLFWVWFVALITTGTAFEPFGIPARYPQTVLLVLTEDDWSSTVLPRLTVAEADLSRIRVVCIEKDGSGSPIFPAQLPIVTDYHEEFALLVVDAWLDTVPSKINVKDPQQARVALHPWKDAATKTGATMLLTTHTNRIASGSARDKYGITGELRKKARMTLFAQIDANGQLSIGPEKANTTGIVKASIFQIVKVQHFDATDDDDGTIPKMVYVGESEQTAREGIVTAFEAATEDTDTKDCKVWLLKYLQSKEGSHEADKAMKAGLAEGFTMYAIKAAKRRSKVKSRKDGDGPWLWEVVG